MFVWQHGEDQHTVWSWNGAAPDGRTWDQWRQEGLLEVKRPRYYLARSVDPERRGYVSTYGIGAGLVALPAFAVRHWLDLGFLENRAAKWLTAKWVALRLRRIVGRHPVCHGAPDCGTLPGGGNCLELRFSAQASGVCRARRSGNPVRVFYFFR